MQLAWAGYSIQFPRWARIPIVYCPLPGLTNWIQVICFRFYGIKSLTLKDFSFGHQYIHVLFQATQFESFMWEREQLKSTNAIHGLLSMIIFFVVESGAGVLWPCTFAWHCVVTWPSIGCWRHRTCWRTLCGRQSLVPAGRYWQLVKGKSDSIGRVAVVTGSTIIIS